MLPRISWPPIVSFTGERDDEAEAEAEAEEGEFVECGKNRWRKLTRVLQLAADCESWISWRLKMASQQQVFMHDLFITRSQLEEATATNPTAHY